MYFFREHLRSDEKYASASFPLIIVYTETMTTTVVRIAVAIGNEVSLVKTKCADANLLRCKLCLHIMGQIHYESKNI